jgi:hypothetical protein
LREEAAVNPDEKPAWLGIFSNFERFRGDHIAVYIVRKWHRDPAPVKSMEIIEQRFFDLRMLPDGIIDGARRRLKEAFLGRSLSNEW